ncbi:MAG: hypothetical protein LBH28_04815 [Oscillospiraceae bacterium]|jgi:hypothetical protein|nr:hypothetical protein [Oscillospiraceae bacterium]
MFDDTSLICLVIEDLAEKKHWTYEEALDRFYHSETCKGISDAETGMFTFAPREIVGLFEEEIG